MVFIKTILLFYWFRPYNQSLNNLYHHKNFLIYLNHLMFLINLLLLNLNFQFNLFSSNYFNPNYLFSLNYFNPNYFHQNQFFVFKEIIQLIQKSIFCSKQLIKLQHLKENWFMLQYLNLKPNPAFLVFSYKHKSTY